MLCTLKVVPAAAKAGLCIVDSIVFLLLRFNLELLCILGLQPLPDAEFHDLGADHASNRLAREEPIKHIEADVPACGAPRDVAAINVVPERETRAATDGFKFPPDVVAAPFILEHLGSVGPRHFGFGNQ